MTGWPRSITWANCTILASIAYCTASNAAAVIVLARRISLDSTEKMITKRGTTLLDTYAQRASAAWSNLKNIIERLEMEIYQTKFGGTVYRVAAINWADSSASVIFDGEPTQWQVADFCHWPQRAMRQFLEDIVESSGVYSDEYDGEVDAAVDSVKEEVEPEASEFFVD